LDVSVLVATKAGSIMGPIASVFGYIMDFLFRITSSMGIMNIGLCIILFTIITKLLLFPLTIKQQESSKLMSLMNPEIKAVQNKYKGKLLVYKIDVDQEPEIARLFKIEAMPTIVFVNSKSNFVSEIGYRDYNEFEALVQKYFFSK
jgi:membrane protein insertase Oxa1/YidC/SpoIIIJ